jgi:putative lipoic acid-binding regulatory protein
MSMEENVNAGLSGDPYENFRSLLQQSIVFPTEYTFKFIIKAEEDKIAELKSMFASARAKITENSSSTGKYKSFTVLVFVQDEEEVIAYYKEVSKINSVIML